jgi:hypothetical protein
MIRFVLAGSIPAGIVSPEGFSRSGRYSFPWNGYRRSALQNPGANLEGSPDGWDIADAVMPVI